MNNSKSNILPSVTMNDKKVNIAPYSIATKTGWYLNITKFSYKKIRFTTRESTWRQKQHNLDLETKQGSDLKFEFCKWYPNE